MLSPEDRDWLAKSDLLAQLTRHDGWRIYMEDCLEPVIQGLQDMLLNYDAKGPLPPLLEMAQLRAGRLMLKTLITLRQKPEELLNTADRIKAEMGTWGQYVDERYATNDANGGST